MGDIKLDAYLFFEGTCREAMEFYKAIFGGELDIRSYGDTPDSDPANKDLVIHADLKGGDIHLFASDTTRKGELGTGKIQLCLGGIDEARLTKVFEALSDGGNVKSPLKKEFWGDTFGTLTDKYGIGWMVNIAASQAS